MNDKEKLISFINKGKENKPVKEVHIIKDSPTEAHILLVNEDGTNVASNRFEIMDAHDLMTLFENTLDSGLYIDISEDNKKINIKINAINTFLLVNFDFMEIADDERWHNLYLFITELNFLANDYMSFYIRKENINRHFQSYNEEDFTCKFSEILSENSAFILCEGPIETNTGETLIKITENLEKNGMQFNYSNGTTKVFENIKNEYNTYKSINGELYIVIDN